MPPKKDTEEEETTELKKVCFYSNNHFKYTLY